MIEELKNRHLESKLHNSLVSSIIRKYIISNPNSKKISGIKGNSLIIHYRKYDKIKMILLLKFLMPSNQNKYFIIQHSSSHYIIRIINNFFFSNIKVFKEQLYSQVLELGINFVSTSKT